MTESRLVLHCGAEKVERADVLSVATPEPDGSHFPIPHAFLLEEAERTLAANGFEIVSAAHSLAKDGARYFGLLEVRRAGSALEPTTVEVRQVGGLDDPSVHPDYGLVVGLRNTHDKSWAAALTMGSHVFVCDNMAFSGEVILGRKHTRNVMRDIPLLMPRAFAALSHERVNMERRIVAYKESAINDLKAHDWIVRSIVDEKVLPAGKIGDVVEQWRKPKHAEFEPRTTWSLFNAFTEVAKDRGALAMLERRTRGLHGFFDRQIGLNLPTRNEVLVEGLEDAVTANDAR